MRRLKTENKHIRLPMRDSNCTFESSGNKRRTRNKTWECNTQVGSISRKADDRCFPTTRSLTHSISSSKVGKRERYRENGNFDKLCAERDPYDLSFSEGWNQASCLLS